MGEPVYTLDNECFASSKTCTAAIMKAVPRTISSNTFVEDLLLERVEGTDKEKTMNE